MIASIPWLQSALNFFLNIILIIKVVPKYLNSPTFSKDLLSIFILWLHPALWSQDMTMYLVLSAFTKRVHHNIKISDQHFISLLIPPVLKLWAVNLPWKNSSGHSWPPSFSCSHTILEQFSSKLEKCFLNFQQVNRTEKRNSAYKLMIWNQHHHVHTSCQQSLTTRH